MVKKMKNMAAILFVGIALLGQSCTSWLDITPEAQVNDKKMFSTPQGFMDVLNGIYIDASGETLYGNNLLFGFVDVMAQYYDLKRQTHEYIELGKYNYKDVKISPQIDKIWKEMYFCIANCNILLQELEKVGPEFFDEERIYYIIRGEATALRAYFHFDLLRLFAPSYKADPDYLAIPYMTRYSNQVQPQRTVTQVLDSVVLDLKRGLKDLEERDPIFDPLYQGREDIYMWTQPMPDRNDFLSYRGYRLNYYAVNAMLARVCAYRLEKKEAYDYAKTVLESGVFKFTNYWNITGDIQYRNRILRPEIIFGFNVPNLTNIYQPYYAPLSYSYDKYLTVKNNDYLFKDTPNDYRKVYLMDWETIPNQPSCLKFAKPLNSGVEGQYGRIAPMIRMSEMYYYLCEYLADVDLDGAKAEFQKLRDARNAKNSLQINTPADMLNEIVKDARREFMCEGQMFYFYKRLGRQVLNESGDSQMSAKDFVLPLPDVELEFGDRLSELYK